MATPNSASADTTIPQSSSTRTLPHVNLRNPTPLSATQEGQVRDLYYKRVRGHCAAEIKEFAACAINRTVSATWVCRQQRLAMNSCMVAHAKPEEEDRAREEWFAGREQRRKAREDEDRKTEVRRKEVIELMRADEEKRRREEEEKMRRNKG
ncbi:hypothetical protein AJ80_00040 [Polytolypa hystricis UAMH7299]|uniref:COX assembly mitochondrial protein n=1 Tax=Polytolypa hystricis (strain UAMH7299) TaxID=1447883 RepID=A0A2B7Z417_POLH7|nr:hypothetical protein AJ80_00040 [Polytolypa hystricis UAMH7299]